MSRKDWKFKILYDAGCPICEAEISWLKGKDKNNYLITEDINEPSFDASRYGKSHEELMRSIHGVFPDGRIVTGIDAVIGLYGAVGFGWLWMPAKLPFVRPMYDLAYRLFARYRLRHRLRIRRCEEGRCKIN